MTSFGNENSEGYTSRIAKDIGVDSFLLGPKLDTFENKRKCFFTFLRNEL